MPRRRGSGSGNWGVKLLIAVAVFGVLIAIHWIGDSPRNCTVTLDITGTKGLPITVTCEVDGNTQQLKRIVPTKIDLEGKLIVFWITREREVDKLDPKKQQLSVKLYMDGTDFNDINTEPEDLRKGGVRGWAEGRSRWQKFNKYPQMGTLAFFEKGKEDEWDYRRVAPPPKWRVTKK